MAGFYVCARLSGWRMGAEAVEGAAVIANSRAERQRRRESHTEAQRHRGTEPNGSIASTPRRSTPLCNVLLGMVLICSAFQYRSAAFGADRSSVLVVVGAAGEKDFGEQFEEWAGR